MRICFFFYDDNLARTCDPTWRWRDPVHVTPISPPTVSRDIYRSLSPPLSRKSRNHHISPYFVACRTPHWIHASSLPRENENVFLETGGGEKKKNTAISRGRGSTNYERVRMGFQASVPRERASLCPWMEGNGRKVFSIDG